MNPNQIKEMRIPLEFVRFAFIEGKMFSHFRKGSTFVTQPKRSWGNSVVYGAIFLLKDFDFYIRIMDAYHVCSKSTMQRNHALDIHHRTNTRATPISFDSLKDLERLKYAEHEEIVVQTYLGNINHPKITQRLNKTNSYRIIDGIDVGHFTQLYREVNQ